MVLTERVDRRGNLEVGLGAAQVSGQLPGELHEAADVFGRLGVGLVDGCQLVRQLTADFGRTQADFQIAAAIDPLGEYHAKWLLNAAIMVMADAAGPPEEVPDATPDDAG